MADKAKKPEPDDEVGTRTGFTRYKWELKSSNKEFWRSGHAVVKLISVVRRTVVLRSGMGRRKSWLQGSSEGLGVRDSPLQLLMYIFSTQICLFIALAYFNAATAHPALTLIITLEVFIFFFFIIVYSFAIQRYLVFILWPVSVSEGQWERPGWCALPMSLLATGK